MEARLMTIADAWPNPWSLGVPAPGCGPPVGLDLSGSEGPHGCAPMAARRALEAVRENRRDEHEARHLLLQAISRRHSVAVERIAVAAGCRLLLPGLLRSLALLRPESQGRLVALPAEAPPLHRLAVLQAGLEGMALPERDSAEWLQRWMSVLEQRRPLLLLVAHPVNPTGAVFVREELCALLEAAARAGVRVVVDEAYADYAGDHVLRSAAMLDDYPHLLVLRSFSSVYGLGLLPSAYALGTADLISCVGRLLTGAEPGYVAARAAEGALQEPSFERMVVDRVGRSRFRATQEMLGMGARVICGHGPWMVVHGLRGDHHVERLAARGVRVRNLGPWGMAGAFRVRAGREDEMEGFVKAVREVLGR